LYHLRDFAKESRQSRCPLRSCAQRSVRWPRHYIGPNSFAMSGGRTERRTGPGGKPLNLPPGPHCQDSLRQRMDDLPLREDLTVDEVCRRHNLSSGYVRREIKDGRLPAFRFGRGSRGPLRIPHSGYVSWLDSYRLEPSPEGAW